MKKFRALFLAVCLSLFAISGLTSASADPMLIDPQDTTGQKARTAEEPHQHTVWCVILCAIGGVCD